MSSNDLFEITELQSRFQRATGQSLSREEAAALLSTQIDALTCAVIIPEEAQANIRDGKQLFKFLVFSIIASFGGLYLARLQHSPLMLIGHYLFFLAAACGVFTFFMLSLEWFKYMENIRRGRDTLYYYPLWTTFAFPVCSLGAALVMTAPDFGSTFSSVLSTLIPSHVPYYYLLIVVVSGIAGYLNQGWSVPIRVHTLIFSGIGMVLCVDGHYWAYPATVAFVVGKCLAVRAKMSS